LANKNTSGGGTNINRTLDGRCVTTIVLIRPIREATLAAAKAESAARMFAPIQKKQGPIAVHGAQSDSDQSLHQDAPKNSPDSGSKRAGNVVPGKDVGSFS